MTMLKVYKDNKHLATVRTHRELTNVVNAFGGGQYSVHKDTKRRPNTEIRQAPVQLIFT